MGYNDILNPILHCLGMAFSASEWLWPISDLIFSGRHLIFSGWLGSGAALWLQDLGEQGCLAQVASGASGWLVSTPTYPKDAALHPQSSGWMNISVWLLGVWWWPGGLTVFLVQG